MEGITRRATVGDASKRLVAFIVAATICVSLMPAVAWADSTPSSGTSGDNAAYTLDDDDITTTFDEGTGILTISGTGEVGSSDISHRSGIVAVVIEEGITGIGDYAFENCTSLTSVDIPDSVTSIGDYAFYGCTSLISVTIPDSVTSIGVWAFAHCLSLKSVDIPDSVTSIGYGAFCGCTSLTSVIIGDSVTSIGLWAFCDCTSLTSVIIGDSVTSIGEEAFEGCTSLTSVTIPDSVTSIGGYAFEGCTALTSVTIPDSVTSIGDCAFASCLSLKSVTIPNSVTSIGDWAFFDCPSLTIYYAGSEDEWNAIHIGEDNSYLRYYTISYGTPTISSVKNAKKGVAVSWGKIDGADGYYVYRNGAKVATVTSGSTVSYTDATAKNGKKYTYTVVAYSGSTASAVSAAKTTYRLANSKITSAKSKAAKKATVKWKKNARSSGYQIRYSTSKNFSKAQTVTVKGKKNVKKVISGLKSGKKYSFQVRSYKKVGGTKYYSAWSAKKSVKVSK